MLSFVKRSAHFLHDGYSLTHSKLRVKPLNFGREGEGGGEEVLHFVQQRQRRTLDKSAS